MTQDRYNSPLCKSLEDAIDAFGIPSHIEVEDGSLKIVFLGPTPVATNPVSSGTQVSTPIPASRGLVLSLEGSINGPISKMNPSPASNVSSRTMTERDQGTGARSGIGTLVNEMPYPNTNQVPNTNQAEEPNKAPTPLPPDPQPSSPKPGRRAKLGRGPS